MSLFEMSPRRFMCNNFTFGGINTSLILERWTVEIILWSFLYEFCFIWEV